MPPKWKTFRLRRIVLVLAPLLLIASFFLAHRLLFPGEYEQIACVIQEPDGNVSKGWGRSECLNNSKPTIVLTID